MNQCSLGAGNSGLGFFVPTVKSDAHKYAGKQQIGFGGRQEEV